MPLKLVAPEVARAPERDFSEFYARYYRRVEAYARRCFGTQASEEIAQEVMARALDRFDSLDRTEDAWGWLCVVTRNFGRQLLRQEGRCVVDLDEQRVTEMPDESARLPEEHVLELEQANLLTRALARLTPTDRQLLLMRHIDERSVGDIAALFGESENLTRQKLFRARKRLATQFASVGGRVSALLFPVWRLLRRNSSQSTTISAGMAAMSVAAGIAVFSAALPALQAPTVRILPRNAIHTTSLDVAITKARVQSAVSTAALRSAPSASVARTAPAGDPAPPVKTRLEVSSDPRKPGQTAAVGVWVNAGGQTVFVSDEAVRGEGKAVACYVLPTTQTC